MKCKRYAHIVIGLTLLSLGSLCVAPPPARGELQEETPSVLGSPDAETTSTGRFSRLVSRTAENVTVVTAAEIEGLNAHTLSDILSTIPGMQLEHTTGPASGVAVHLQGADFGHVLVLLDGVPFNNLADNFSDVGLIPAQIIDRVEIVKGAASSSWGQALGGVINVITKSPETERKASGAVSLSHGGRGTDDARAEVSGTLERFGYHLAGGYFGSDGFHPNTDARLGNAFGKLTYDLPGQGRGIFSFFYAGDRRGEFALNSWDLAGKDSARRLIFSASVSKPLSDRIDLEVSAHNSSNNMEVDASYLSTNTLLQAVKGRENAAGGSTKLLWHGSDNSMVLGADYDHVRLRQSEALTQVDLLSRDADRIGLYLNDTYTVGRLSLSPGARYDVTGSSQDQFSPSFGLTWQAGDNTTLRGYTASGYSLPSFNLERGAEKVWTAQLGAETSAVPYLWLKGTLFRNDTWNITVFDSQTGNLLSERQLKQGVETEARTAPVCNTALSLGYTFVDARRSSDHSIVESVPRHAFLTGLHYDDGALLRGSILGTYIDWRSAPYLNGSYGGMIWDARLNLTPFGRGNLEPEFFLTLHNALNGAQYPDEAYKNPTRWFEGGVRCRF